MCRPTQLLWEAVCGKSEVYLAASACMIVDSGTVTGKILGGWGQHCRGKIFIVRFFEWKTCQQPSEAQKKSVNMIVSRSVVGCGVGSVFSDVEDDLNTHCFRDLYSWDSNSFSTLYCMQQNVMYCF